MSKTIAARYILYYDYKYMMIFHNGLQVAEMVESKELVGVVKGCIKSVQTPSGSLFKMGCILGLRVSPTHR